MKKWMTLILVLVVVAALFSGCGQQPPDTQKEPAGSSDEPSAPAQQDSKLKITVDLGDGSEPAVTEVEKGSAFEAPAEPSRKNFIFDGWTVNGEKASFPYNVSRDIVVTAQWLPEPAEKPVIAVQPEAKDVECGTSAGPVVEISPARGYFYAYQWFYSETDANSGGTKIEGADGAACAVPMTLEVGKVIYVYCEITATRVANKEQASEISKTAKVTITPGVLHAMVVGSGLNANGYADVSSFLEGLINASGTAAQVDRVTKGNSWNIWETGFTGDSQSTIVNMMKEKKYSCIILQIGRDYVLTTGSTADKEMAAVQTICKAAKETNPECKVILQLVPWRQDTGSSYWSRYAPAGITDVAKHKEAIRKYTDNLAKTCGYDVIVADIMTGFEKCLEAGINPFIDDKSDYCSVEGGYLTACICYAEMFGKSPESLQAFEASTPESVMRDYFTEVETPQLFTPGDAKFVIDPASAAKIQKIAADIALAQ